MRPTAALKAFTDFVGARVHASAADDPLAAVRHRAFIASHLAGGVLPFACLPLALALGGAPSALELAAFAWLTAPILIALHLSRTGDLVRAHLLSALALTGLVTVVAAATGGLGSFAASLLALALLEAALSGARRAVFAALAGVVAAAALLAGLAAAGALPDPIAGGGVLMVVGGASAAVYAVALAIRTALAVRAGDALGRSGRAQFELFACSVSDLVTRHDPNGAVTFASPASERLLGVAPRDLSGQGLLERVHILDRPVFLHALAGGAISDRPTSVELRVRRRSGAPGSGGPEFVWVEMRCRAVRPHEAAGEAARAEPSLAVFRDISDRKAYEEALLAARAEADLASAAKTRFLANMSHELRTPLNAIIGFSEILADDDLRARAPARSADYAALIHQSGVHLLDVVNGILDMSKIETGNFAIFPEPCAVGPVVDHCVKLMALKAEGAGLSLTARVAPDVPEIVADRRALTQVLLNLLSNAIKFTPRGGDVAVDVRRSGGGVALSVRDTGVGVAPEHIGRLGEAFFQVSGAYDRPHEGAGLGLSVVRGLVDLHGGRLAIESAVGQGACVTVTLPMDAAAAVRPASRPTVERPAFGRAPAALETTAARVKKRA